MQCNALVPRTESDSATSRAIICICSLRPNYVTGYEVWHSWSWSSHVFEDDRWLGLVIFPDDRRALVFIATIRSTLCCLTSRSEWPLVRSPQMPSEKEDNLEVCVLRTVVSQILQYLWVRLGIIGTRNALQRSKWMIRTHFWKWSNPT